MLEEAGVRRESEGFAGLVLVKINGAVLPTSTEPACTPRLRTHALRGDVFGKRKAEDWRNGSASSVADSVDC